ncbi:hypothetical protein [uncultured Sphingomonas sp.]|uniref:hypothetical protein n=1 Tax=uncultured Sphingomonas sp. TaxID=158754 RepID=UPI0035CC44C0
MRARYDAPGLACNRLASAAKARHDAIVIHLSVAIGRFLEALFYAILRVAGVLTLAAVGIAAVIGLMFGAARWAIRRR